MKRKKKPAIDDEIRLKRIQQNYLNSQYENEFGLDPGARYILGGVERNISTQKETSVLYSSASCRYDIGEHNRSIKYRYWTKDFFLKIDAERNNLPEKASQSGDPLIFIDFEMKHLLEWQELVSQKKFAKLKFEQYIRKRKIIDEIARKIMRPKRKTPNDGKTVERKKKNIIFAGTTEISPIIKGYVKAPLKSLIRSLSRFADVVMVDEFRTTMLCSNCYQPALTSSSPHRWQHCNECAIMWNRDINAGRNILYLGRARLLGMATNNGFSREFEFEQ